VYQGLHYDIAAVMPEALATGLFVSVVTIQEPDGVFVGSGQSSGNWVDVSGLVNIKAMNAPISDSKILADEVKTLAETMAVNLRHVLLDGYYPQIEPGQRAFMDGVYWDILGAEADSQSQMTRLHLELATL
jgi:hypothetical protein